MVQYLEIKNNALNISKINKSLKLNHCNIIAVYMPGCIHCEMLYPEWKKAGQKLSKSSNSNGIVSFINMKYMNQLNINTSSIIGFPHIVAIKNGKELTYNGPRDNMSLYKWMSTLCPSKSIKKKSQTRKKKQSKNKRKKNKRTRKMQKRRKN